MRHLLPRPRRSSESGFTMVELLVVVIIIAILAAIAVPVYINLRNTAAVSAMKSDVNATVKQVSIALTQGASIAEVTANGGADYVKITQKGEDIKVIPVDASGNVTTASYRTDIASDQLVISTGLYRGSGFQAKTAVASATSGEVYFAVQGSLNKSAGAPVNADYGYTSNTEKYTQPAGGTYVGPTASFTLSNSALTTSVDASGTTDPDGTVTGYSWNWGDGSTAGSGATATHTYSTVGTYTVTLTTTDNHGKSNSATKTVTTTSPNLSFASTFEPGDTTRPAWWNNGTCTTADGPCFSNAAARTGSYSLIMNPNWTTTANLKLTQGTSYTLTFYYRAANTTDRIFIANFYGASTQFIPAAPVANQWTKYSFTTTATSGSQAQWLQMAASNTNKNPVYVDDLTITPN